LTEYFIRTLLVCDPNEVIECAEFNLFIEDNPFFGGINDDFRGGIVKVFVNGADSFRSISI
jgi:hypothetical protein